MVAIVDYGVGNLFSIICSFNAIGVKAQVTSNPRILKEADKILLPGVGAFKDSFELLKKTGLDKVILEQAHAGKDILGICLGMQLLFDMSLEDGQTQGLGLISGEIRPISEVVNPNYKIPHIGWNKLKIYKKDCKLVKYLKDGDYGYFVHSYQACNCKDSLVATTDYDGEITSIVHKDNVYGCQFHPEKSSNVGLSILKAFCED